METYYVKLTCGNCGNKEGVQVPKGTSISEFCGHGVKGFGYECPVCGCATMHESRDPIFRDDSKIL